MMKRFLKRNKAIFHCTFAAVLAAVAFSACNKSVNNGLESPDNAQNPQAKERKVLMIVIDGGLGNEIKKIAAPVITDLTENAIFSWDAINSTKNTVEVTNEQGWATLLTGVNPDKHNVISTAATNNFNQYPTVFTRLKTLEPGLRSVVISSSSALTGQIAADATEKKLVANDAAVKDAAIAEMSSGNPGFVMVQFSGVDAAGLAEGYMASSAAYRAAVLNVDSYIGAILEALNKRANAPNEDWMVIITSSKGNSTVYNPVGKPWSAFDDARHNNFLLITNPRFGYNNKEKPTVFPYYGTTNSYRIGSVTGTSRRNASVKDATAFNYGITGSFSVQCKVKVPSSSNYPSFLGKRLAFSTSAGNHGWVFFLENGDWQANFNGANGSGGNTQARGTAITNNQWHNLNLVVTQVSSTVRNATVYTDGVKNATTNIGARDLSTTAPFMVGWRDGSTGGDIQMLVTDVRIYNRALTDAEIANNYCRTDADLTDPSLVGFWPSTIVEYDDAGNPYLRDYTAGGNHLFLNNPSIVSFSEGTPNACPLVDEVAYKTVPQSVDVATQIYLWMGYTIPQGWGLEGQSWIPKYVDLVE
ncbi:MAG: alkaline phosphatase family protein [Niabella sp.]